MRHLLRLLPVAALAYNAGPPVASAQATLAPRPACSTGAPTAEPDAAPALLASLRRLATLEAVANGLADDAALLWPGSPVLMAHDAAMLLRSAHRDAAARLQWQPLGLRLASDTSLAATWGTLLRAAPDSAPSGIALEVRYIAVHRREGRCWRITALMVDGVPVRAVRATLPPALPTAAAPFADADRAFAAAAAADGAGPAFARWSDASAQMRDRDGLVVVGPTAIARLVDGPARWRWSPVTGGAAASGDLGWTIGEAVITAPDGTPRFSKYLTIWLRHEDGRIRFLTDGGNARPAD